MRCRLRELPPSTDGRTRGIHAGCTSAPAEQRSLDRRSPSHWETKAGDRNRTGSRSLEGFCATKTLRPRAPRAFPRVMLPAAIGPDAVQHEDSGPRRPGQSGRFHAPLRGCRGSGSGVAAVLAISRGGRICTCDRPAPSATNRVPLSGWSGRQLASVLLISSQFVSICSPNCSPNARLLPPRHTASASPRWRRFRRRDARISVKATAQRTPPSTPGPRPER